MWVLHKLFYIHILSYVKSWYVSIYFKSFAHTVITLFPLFQNSCSNTTLCIAVTGKEELKSMTDWVYAGTCQLIKLCVMTDLTEEISPDKFCSYPYVTHFMNKNRLRYTRKPKMYTKVCFLIYSYLYHLLFLFSLFLRAKHLHFVRHSHAEKQWVYLYRCFPLFPPCCLCDFEACELL